MLTLLSILFWLAVTAGAIALLGFLAGRFYQEERQHTGTLRVDTEDGWHLSLSRYRPAHPIRGAPPVLLCPGTGLSADIFDGRDLSLARFLAEHGHDVWLLDFRGRGTSERPRLWGRRRYTWSFDDYVEFDLPAALEAIARETGAPSVQAVGFGGGALVLLAAAAGQAAPRLHSLACLAAPVFFRKQGHLFSPRIFGLLRRLRLESAVRPLAPLLGRLFPGPLVHLQNRDNIDGATYRRALVNAVCSLTRKEAQGIAAWLREDAFAGTDRTQDYRQHLPAVTIPSLHLCGPRDPLAPVEMVEATLAALGGPSEERIVSLASRMHGMSANYGHLDLLIGRNAARDIYPRLLVWLDERAGIDRPAGPLSRSSGVPRSEALGPENEALGSEDELGPEDEALGSEDEALPVGGDPLVSRPARLAPPETAGASHRTRISTPGDEAPGEPDTPEELEDEEDWIAGDVPHVPPRS